MCSILNTFLDKNNRNLPFTIIFAAHPDDEIIGIASCLTRFAKILVVYITDGVPRDISFTQYAGFTTQDEYCRARYTETICALEKVNFHKENALWLHYFDQEVHTRIIDLMEEVKKIIIDYEPRIVITHPYEGGHPDHDTVALCVSVISKRINRIQPSFSHLEFTSYNNYLGIPNFQTFIPYRYYPEITMNLTDEEQLIKNQQLNCHKSQAKMLQNFHTKFEKMRFAPDYNFYNPPHSGTLFYETLGWNITKEQWRKVIFNQLLP